MRLTQLTLVAALAAAFPLSTFAADAPASPAQKPWLDRSLSADKRAELAVKAFVAAFAVGFLFMLWRALVKDGVR